MELLFCCYHDAFATIHIVRIFIRRREFFCKLPLGAIKINHLIMKKSILIILIIITRSVAFSQDTTSFNIGKTENKFVYSQNTIKIFKGQRISVKSISSKGQLNELQLVDTTESKIVSHSKLGLNVLQQSNEANITIDLNTIEQDGKTITYLIVNNPYKGTLTYKAKFFSRRSNDYIETSIYPISPGIYGIETWPYPIADLILYDFTIKE
jgi:hypothetical protein